MRRVERIRKEIEKKEKCMKNKKAKKRRRQE